jgi:outer membrane protein insertion porin family
MGSGLPASPSGRESLMGEGLRPSTLDIVPSGPSLSASEELVSDIRVEGNKTVPASRITAAMSTRVGRPFDPQALSRDVRKLASMPWFTSVRPYSEITPEGRVVILRVAERSLIRYVEYLGNSKLKDKRLKKETGLEVGAAVDPYMVEDGRRKLQALYAENGFPHAQVSVLEGNKADDKGVIYVINEGVKQKISSVSFEGNDSDFVSDHRLKTRIQSKPGFMHLFGGKLDRDKLDDDVRKLTEYYRAFGFFQARVGRTLEFNDEGNKVDLRFVIHEGPRYEVRSVRFVGNEKFSDDSLSLGVKMPAGEPFEQAKMNADVEWLKEVYGSQGYVFADVKAEPVFLEEPGKIDLVYHMEEGKRWRVGRIFVHIGGENPHTRIQTALNRLSIRPGEIMDIRELRASERRLQASQLFLADPSRGVMPKITYRIPELDDTEFTASAGGDSIRGQSPEAGSWVYEQFQRAGRSVYRAFSGDEPAMPAADAVPMDIYLDLEDESAVLVEPPLGNGLLAPTVEVAPVPSPIPYTVRKPPITERNAWLASGELVHDNYANLALPAESVVRGQSPAGTPSVYGDSSAYGGTLPGATSPATVQRAPAVQPVQPVQYQQPLAGYPPQQTYPQQSYPPQQAYPPAQPQAYPPASTYAAQPTYPPQPTGAPPQTAQPQTVYQPPPPAYPPQSPGNLPPPGQQVYGEPVPAVAPDPQLFPGQPFATPGAYTDPVTDIHVQLEEAQTGRFMVGVGVNSDAGVVGQILVDERNFDWKKFPRSMQDIYNGTAWRGGGQSFRIEAAPGTQVQRYMASFTNPYVFDTPFSLSLSGSYFTRRYDYWDEQRTGGRVSYGYQWTENDLSARLTYRGEVVNISNAATLVVPELTDEVGDNSLNGFGVVIANDTRNNPFLATEGHYVELQLEQVIGTYDYPRAVVDARKYFLINERPDHSGRHVMVAQTRVGFTGDNTPVYDSFFAGGYSTMRGFDFRGASPLAGGDFMWLNTLEYMFPLTADDMVNGVVFCDFGTVEPTTKIENFRVSPGVGLRIQVPAMGPAPIALDFAWPVSRADTDELQVFQFNVGFMR